MKKVLVFGVGPLQSSLIKTAKIKGYITVGIDPNPNAECRDDVDFFEVVAPDDLEKTLEVARRYGIDGIVTASTDKPLVMMAKVAEIEKFKFFTVETAVRCTDKLQMKETFVNYQIPCAKGYEILSPEDYKGNFPVILKPRDNSGSRGVIFCRDEDELRISFSEVMSHTRKNTVLVEEFIEGREFSIEAFHYNKTHSIIQITEKETTPFPYNVELAHLQPAALALEIQDEIKEIINKIGVAFEFNNCPSHTELKVSADNAITVIETSPRLGGDFITSHLVPLSTGINMESILLDIAVGNSIRWPEAKKNASMVHFFNLNQEEFSSKFLKNLESIKNNQGVRELSFTKKEGERLPIITNSLDRYGYFIISAENRANLVEKRERILQHLTA